MATGPKSQIILDWFTVTYRSVFLGGMIVLLVGGFLWYTRCGPGASGPANAAIISAETKYAEAARLPAQEAIDTIRASARSALEEARSARDASRWEDAVIAANQSENLSVQAIALARGDEAGGNGVRIYKIEGDVRVKRAGQFAWEPATRGMVVRAGDQVKTSSSSTAQLHYFDGTITTVQKGSLLEIRQLSEDPGTKVRKVAEKLSWGEILASTQKRNVEGSFHEITTEKVAARSEEGGEFRVRYDQEEGTAAFDVFQGRVLVTGPSSTESLGAGERVRAAADGALAGKELLPGVPRLVAPTDQRVFVYDNPASETTTLSWEKVPGTGKYHLQISDRLLFSNPLYDDFRADTSVVIDAIPAGTYFWKVSAVSPAEVEGPYSEVRSFRVTSQRIRDAGDQTPPKLEIQEPVQTGPMLIINGKTEPGALLWIDGEKVDVYDDGSFYAVVRLRKEGVNEVVFEAQDAAGNKARVTKRALVESY
jgi:hypothetical protein